jgi:hypothetical protein
LKERTLSLVKKTNYLLFAAFAVAACGIALRKPVTVSPEPVIAPKAETGFVAQEVIRDGVKTYVFTIEVNPTIASTVAASEPRPISTYDLLNPKQ